MSIEMMNGYIKYRRGNRFLTFYKNIMLFQVMQLILKLLERKVIVSSSINKWYRSEWYDILFSGNVFTIKKWSVEVILGRDDSRLSESYKSFYLVLKDFLDLTFPK